MFSSCYWTGVYVLEWGKGYKYMTTDIDQYLSV